MPLNAARALERLAGASVEAGERRAIFRFVGGLFLLLTAYYVLKVVREPLILATGGAVGRSYARALQAGLLVAVIPLYSALANRVSPAGLVQYVFLFFVAALDAYIHWYNEARIKISLGSRSPVEHRRELGIAV